MNSLGTGIRALAVATTITVTLCAAGPTRQDAMSLKQKMDGITRFAERPGKQPNRTMVTENEVNAYLSYDGASQLPAGVAEPVVSILGTGRVSGRALVDLDAIRKQKNPTSLFDPASYLTGRLPVMATGVLKTSNGVGRFELESATVASVPIPKTLLQEILSYYSRTPDKPGGLALDAPFDLPARIREIQVNPGQAIIVQ